MERKDPSGWLLLCEGLIQKGRKYIINLQGKSWGQETVVERIKKKRLQWFGHVERMEEERLPIAALHGHVEGKRNRRRQRKIWMDNVRKNLMEKNIDLTRIGQATRNREI